jgi:hypothetical protein
LVYKKIPKKTCAADKEPRYHQTSVMEYWNCYRKPWSAV